MGCLIKMSPGTEPLTMELRLDNARSWDLFDLTVCCVQYHSKAVSGELARSSAVNIYSLLTAGNTKNWPLLIYK